MRSCTKDLYDLNLPYDHTRIAVMLRDVGLHWRHASDAEVRATVAAYTERARKGRPHRPPRKALQITVDVVTLTATEWAALAGVSVTTFLRRVQSIGDPAEAVRRSLATPGVWTRAASNGPHKGRVVIGGERATAASWCKRLGYTRQYLWLLAKRNGRTTAQEIEARVLAKARASQKEAAE